MKTIHKFKMHFEPSSEGGIVRLPGGAEVLSLQLQGKDIMLWALVDTENPTFDRRYQIVGTGWVLDHLKLGEYIGTVQVGRHVWHFFFRD